MASSLDAPSSSSIPPKQYDVFLSFKGEVREGFLSHLIENLKKKHVLYFYDKENLRYSQDIKEQLDKAIPASHIAIMVLSRGYADSSWCLDEMLMIMKCRKKYGMTVIPVFLGVEPSVVRKCPISSSFGVAFAEHQLKGVHKAKVAKWKKHLMSVPAKCGEDVQLLYGSNQQFIEYFSWVAKVRLGWYVRLWRAFQVFPGSRPELSQNLRDEALKVKKISQAVLEELGINNRTSTEKLVGMESRAGEMSVLIEQSNETLFLGIHGTGGSGKTTVTRYVFNKFRHNRNFDESCFLDVGSVTELVKLQRTLLSEFLHADVHVANKEDGTDRISRNLRGIRVLLVLDNVMDDEILSALAGEKEWFKEGSVIIVTTRDTNLLHGLYRPFEVVLLSPEESMTLFCKHAFVTGELAKGYERLSNCFVNYASGLPLALKVIGCHLKPLEEGEWESLQESLGEMPEEFDAKITSVLRISYDGLTPSQQEMFLDIACFSTGETEEEVKEKSRSLGLDPRFFEALITKSLIHLVPVYYGEDLGVKQVRKFVDMHDLIREMGWRIVRQVANRKVKKYSRLWKKKDVEEVCDMLSTNNTVKVKAMGMIVEEEGSGENLANALGNMNKLRFVEVYYSYRTYVPPCSLPVESLQWLCLKLYPAEALPENPNTKWSRLVCLKMQRSKLKQSPDVSKMPNLEILNLSGSVFLEGLHESIGSHKKLKNVDFARCLKLSVFPTISEMESLEILDLSATAIETIPEIQNADKLWKLDLSDVYALTSLPWYIGFASGLKELKLINTASMPVLTLPPSFYRLKHLEILQIHHHQILNFGEEPNDDDDDFVNLPSLKGLVLFACGLSELIITKRTGWLRTLHFLDLSSNYKLVSLPQSLRLFSCLRTLLLNDCTRLDTISELPSSLTSLEMRGCKALRRMPSVLQLLDQNKHWRLLDMQECCRFAKTHQCLLSLSDKNSVYQMLQKRNSLLQVFLPGIIPKWFSYEQTGGCVVVTLDLFSPSSIRGFVVISFSPSSNNDAFELRTPENNALLERLISKGRRREYSNNTEDMGYTGFLYIPIDDVINNTNWEDDPYLFEVYSSGSGAKRWGFHVVYKTGVDEANSGLKVKIEEQLPEENIDSDEENIDSDEDEGRLAFNEAILLVKIGSIRSENCERMSSVSVPGSSTDEPSQENSDSTTNNSCEVTTHDLTQL